MIINLTSSKGLIRVEIIEAPEMDKRLFDAIRDCLRDRVSDPNEVQLSCCTLGVLEAMRDAGYVIARKIDE
jgi:hypothetical protein